MWLLCQSKIAEQAVAACLQHGSPSHRPPANIEGTHLGNDIHHDGTRRVVCQLADTVAIHTVFQILDDIPAVAVISDMGKSCLASVIPA